MVEQVAMWLAGRRQTHEVWIVGCKTLLLGEPIVPTISHILGVAIKAGRNWWLRSPLEFEARFFVSDECDVTVAVALIELRPATARTYDGRDGVISAWQGEHTYIRQPRETEHGRSAHDRYPAEAPEIRRGKLRISF